MTLLAWYLSWSKKLVSTQRLIYINTKFYQNPFSCYEVEQTTHTKFRIFIISMIEIKLVGYSEFSRYVRVYVLVAKCYQGLKLISLEDLP